MRFLLFGLIALCGNNFCSAQFTDERVDRELRYLYENPINDPEEAIQLCDSIISYCEEHALNCQLVTALAQKGIAYALQVKFRLASENILEAQRVLDRAECDPSLPAFLYWANSYTFRKMKDFHAADSFALMAIRMFNPEWADKLLLIKLHGDLGRSDKGMPFALAHLDTAYQLSRLYHYPSMEQQALINIGSLYAMNGAVELAGEYLKKALVIAKEAGTYNHITGIYNNLAGLSSKPKEILNYLDSASHYAALADDVQAVELIMENKAYLYYDLGKYQTAYDSLWKALALKDTVLSVEKYKAIAEMQEKYEAEKKTNEIQSLKLENLDTELQALKYKKTKNRFLAGGLVSLGLASLLGYGFVFIRRSRTQLAVEKGRSDNLLLNILPAEIAEELKEKGHAQAQDFEAVSILFSDFRDFTEIAGKMNAIDLVAELNVCFRQFDGICEKYDIEKIKTIGDSYMAAGGLPVLTDDSVKNTILAALDMQQFIEARKLRRTNEGLPAFEMRIGIHTGPVVAGIVGVKKFQYDVWGDTVNTASRMETNGEVGKVNCSEATFALVRDLPLFSFESRGKIVAKGKGKVEMYFVKLKDVALA